MADRVADAAHVVPGVVAEEEDLALMEGDVSALVPPVVFKMLIEKKGIGEAMRKAVDGMLPRNTLRKERMKRLTIND